MHMGTCNSHREYVAIVTGYNNITPAILDGQ